MKLIFYTFIIFCSLHLIHSESIFSENKKTSTIQKNIKNQPAIEFEKDNTFRITLPIVSGYRKDLYDLNGNLLQSDSYNSKYKLNETEKRSYNSFGFLTTIEKFDKSKNISSKINYSYDNNCLNLKKEESCINEISYFNGSNQTLENEEGIHQYKTEFDLKCLKRFNTKANDCKKIEIRFDKNFKSIADKDGNTKIYRTFNSNGYLNLFEIYDRNEKIKHKVIYAYDNQCIDLIKNPKSCIIFHEYTNKIKIASKVKTNYGKRILSFDLNCIKEKKDSEKCISIEENFDFNGNLKDINHRFTFGCIDYSLELGSYAKKVSKFDNKGNEILREYYNSKNQLIEDSSGGAKYVYAYNQDCIARGHKTQNCRTLTEIYDKDLKLKYKAIFDEECVKSGKANLETPNYCTAWKETYGTVEKKGKFKNKIKITKANFDTNGFKTNLEKYNIKRKLNIKTVFYFEKEKLIKKENQDVNGNLIEDANGIATFIYEYDGSPFTIREISLNKEGKITENKDGIAKMVFAYSKDCLDKKNNRYECSTLEEFYDSNGNLKEVNGNLENTFMYAKKIRRFDNKGNIILEAYYNKNNKLKENHLGIAKYKFSYDESGEILLQEQFESHNKLIQKILYEYDVSCKSVSTDFSCNNSITHVNKQNQLIDRDELDSVPYGKEISTYNIGCIKSTLDPEECFEKKEYLNSNQDIIYAEYYQYMSPPSNMSDIKFIKLKLSMDKIPLSVEFIK